MKLRESSHAVSATAPSLIIRTPGQSVGRPRAIDFPRRILSLVAGRAWALAYRLSENPPS